MYVVRDYHNPITRDLIALAEQYGQPLKFSRPAPRRIGASRFAQMSFPSTSGMLAFRRFLDERGFHAELIVTEDQNSGICIMSCPSAIQ